MRARIDDEHSITAYPNPSSSFQLPLALSFVGVPSAMIAAEHYDGAFHSLQHTAPPSSSSHCSGRRVTVLITLLTLTLLTTLAILASSPSTSPFPLTPFSTPHLPLSNPLHPSSNSIPRLGVCLSGLEDGSRIPGRPNVDFGIPTVSEWAYFHSKRLDLVRLPFKWERMQPNISGPLDPFQLSIIRSQLAIAATLNMSVLLDCHNYARYGRLVINGTTGPLTSTAFADLWRRLATELHGLPGLLGYDLMNEPHDMSSLMIWPAAAQAAIDAIRTVDRTTRIYVEGNQWSGAANWTLLNPGFPLKDPQNLITYSAHCYLDRDGSGTHFDWDEETQHGVTLNTGVERLQSFVHFTQLHQVPGHIGEMGIGMDNEAWFIAYDRALAVMAENQFEHTYWSGGPFFQTYPMGVDVAFVNGRVQDKRQMAVLSKYSHAPSPRVYFLSGPTRGAVGQPSVNFTVDVRGWLQSAIGFRCYDSVRSVPFVQLRTTTEFNAWMNFSYTAAEAGIYQVYCTNDAGYYDAEPIVYVAA